MPDDNKGLPSRMNRRNRSNSVLNVLIGLVFALILITVAFIVIGNGEENAETTEAVTVSNETDAPTVEENTEQPEDEERTDSNSEDEAEDKSEETESASEEESTEEEEKDTVGGTITREESSDPLVSETIVNTSWEPVGTSQTGEHVSKYDGESTDWNEKIKAISYATGLSENDMIIWQIANGGGPQRSVGVVSSSDKSEKYRVYLNWVDGEGWKPEKMDILTSVEGAY